MWEWGHLQGQYGLANRYDTIDVLLRHAVAVLRTQAQTNPADMQARLDQYTDLSAEQQQEIEQRLPEDQLRGFKGAYLEIAQRLKQQQGKDGGEGQQTIDQLEFEFVLFSSTLIDYDYIILKKAVATLKRQRRLLTAWL
jgi:hypothetical protein